MSPRRFGVIPPPIAGSPHNGTLEARSPGRGFLIFTGDSLLHGDLAWSEAIHERRLSSADAFASFSTSSADLSWHRWHRWSSPTARAWHFPGLWPCKPLGQRHFSGFINARPTGRHSMSMLTFVAE